MDKKQINEKWSEMTPRERDAWVAEVVFNIPVHYKYSPRGPVYLDDRTLLNGRINIGDYTTSVNWAKSVRDAIDGEFILYRKRSGSFVASFGYSAEECSECGEEPFEVTAQGISNTAEEAICLAAIMAKLTGGDD